MFSAAAIIWWALHVQVTWAARRKDSAYPGVIISARNSAFVHQLPSSQSPSVFVAAILMWRPPNVTTTLSSPHFSGHFHWICFANANSSWSNVTTSACPRLTCLTAVFTTSMERRIMATVWALSWNMGDGWRLAWKAVQVMFAPSFTVTIYSLSCIF